MPKVSILIPSYNHEKYIMECIQSVLDQSFQDFEIIITDDGSVDNTVAKIKKFKDNRIKLFCFEKNRGASAAVNNCIENSCGEYIAIMNSDDIFVGDKIEKQVNFLEKDTSIGAVLSYISAIDEEGNDILETQIFNYKHFDRENQNKYKWLKLFFSGENALAQPSTLIRRSCYSTIGFYDERFAQIPDWDFWIRFCMNYDLHVIPERLVKYRIRDNNQNISADRPDKRIRISWETSQVLRNFLNINDINEFKKIFPNCYEQPINTKFIPYCIAKMALSEDRGVAYNHFAVDILYEIFKDKKLSLEIEKFYNFSFSDLIDISGERDLFFINERNELNDIIRSKNRLIKEKEKNILFMKSSVFWRARNIYIEIKNVKFLKLFKLINTALLIIRRDGTIVFLKRLNNFIKGLFVSAQTGNRVIIEEKYQDRWNNNEPLVSIIIPCYNYGKFVIEAIESAVSQTFQSIEIIVINDGSTDKDTIDVLNNLNYPKVRVVHQENQGLAQTRNNGALLSKGKYICFLDADDMMMPTYIEKALIILEADGNLGCAYSWLQCFGDNESIWRTQDFDSFVIRNSNIASSHSVIRKSAWDKVFELNNCGFLTKYNGYFEDWVFWIDMIRTGLGGRVIKECLIRYRIHKNSLSATHKPGFSKKLSELKTDRRDFFENNKLADELQEKIYNQIKILNPFENIIEAEFIKSNKSILFIVPWLTCGGVESVLLEKIKGLKFNGFQITIITTEESDNDWEWKFLEVTPFIYHLPNYLDRSDYNKFIFSFINGRNITEVCGVHSSFFYQIAGDMVRRFPKINISDVLHNDSKLGYYESAVKYDKYIKTHIVISNRIKKVIENCGVKREKIKVVYNGIDTFDRFNPRECVKEKTKMNVLFLGRFSPEKRPLDFLKVAKEFANDKDIQFFMGGDGILKKEIDLFIKRNRLKNVKLLGFVKPESTLINSDILVMTSEVEGFPMAALEAMSMKNVVISTNVGEIDKIVLNNKNGFVISEVGGIKAIKEKISYFQNNRNALREMQDSARIHVLENYDVKYMTKGYLEIFSNKK
ncbi:MAG TPA: hypothetical protein DDY52_01940 [Candidatus Moranbacteria bacterium]|nr:MAG: Glycosyl transferase family 2 [Candidatus Moranbacteria bacterium GW2011_GWF1_34_10]HBI16897.1 hypothetical protein [Candidatus Moranbacteria bacterium]